MAVFLEHTLQLLGTPQSFVDGKSQSLTNNQSLLLVAYLAYHEDWVRRDALLLLFWPNDQEKKARHNLSQLVYQLKKQTWFKTLEAEIETESDAYRLMIATDVKVFRDAHGVGEWARAYATYKGDLLDASFTGMSANYENWLQLERENLQQNWREATLNYVQDLENDQNYGQASSLCKQILKQDALAEDALQAYIRNLYKSGQRIEAINAYESFKEQLQLELDMEPLDATIELLSNLREAQFDKSGNPEINLERFAPSLNNRKNSQDSIEADINLAKLGFEDTGSTQVPSISQVAIPKQTLAEHITPTKSLLRNVPTQLTPFVGREVDLAEIANFLNNTDTRLLTLLGPGGMGKTRLSIQTVLEQVHRFEDGVVFVALAAINAKEDNIDSLIQEFAKALDTPFVGEDSPKEQLLNYLRAKEILIVLDNFEHVLDATTIVMDILESSPRSKLIVTSREALGFQSEWLYEVKGLGVPTDGDVSTIELHDATQLFLRRARRVNTHFILQDKDKRLVAQICQLLGGVPLALELAANWLRILSLEDIAAELTYNFDLLETNQKDLPARHHSIRGIFEQSWSLMIQAERDALIKLTVFRSGFTKEASDKVTKIPIRILLSLSNKSMIYRDASGRFERHPLVFEFSQEKAQGQELEAALQALQREHANYYADFLDSKESLLWSAKQQETLSAISAELENIRLAWHWMIKNHQEALLNKALPTLGYYYNVLNLSTEALQMYELALNSVEKNSRIYASLLLYKGNLLRKASDFNGATSTLESAWVIFEQLQDSKAKAQTALHLGGLFYDQDDFEKATQLLETSLKLFKESADVIGEAQVLGFQGRISTLLGNYEKAKELHIESLKLNRQLGYQQGVADELSYLARTYSDLGEITIAIEYAQEGYAIHKTLDKNSGQAKVLESLAHLNWRIGNLDKAESYVKESLRILTLAGHRSSIARSLSHLGVLASERHDLEAAKALFLESLELNKMLNLERRIIFLLGDLGEVVAKQGDFETAKQYFYDALLRSKQRKTDAPTLLNLLLELSRVFVLEENLAEGYKILFTIKNHTALKKNISEKVDTLFEEVVLGLKGAVIETIETEWVQGGLEPLVESLLNQNT